MKSLIMLITLATRKSPLPTCEQAIRCLTLSQSLTNLFIPIAIVRFDERTSNVFMLAGANIEIEIYRNGLWRFIDND
jgi:hypothetical protein